MAFTFDYVRLDYSTLKEKLREELEKEDVFRDYDFAGSNINVLLDLLCYFSEIGLYYTNKVAGEAFVDSVKLYENIHRLASMFGYYPHGWQTPAVDGIIQLAASATSGTLVSIYGEKTGSGFLTWSTGLTDDDTDEEIVYAMTRNFYGIVPSSGQIPVRLTQGVMTEFDFTGKDLVNNKLVIPSPSLSYGYDTKWDEEQWKDIQDPSGVYYNITAASGWQEEPVKVFVYEGTDTPGPSNKWLRVNDFQQDANTTRKYRFYLNKWKRYTIEFDRVRGSIPQITDRIKLQVIRTLGDRGRVVSGTVNLPSESLVYSHTSSAYIDNSNVSLTTSASSGGYEAETIENIREQLPTHVASQDRCVTDNDYKTKLQARADIFKATVWGETDKVTPDLNKLLYIYTAILPAYPDTFSTNYVHTYDSGGFTYISAYTSGWTLTLNEYLTPFKVLNFHLEYVPADVVHLWFNVLVKANRAAGISTQYIKTTVNEKLKRFFKDAEQVGFNTLLKSYSIQQYILSKDTNINDVEDDRVDAIQYLVMRDIRASKQVYEPNSADLYPQWERAYSGYQNEMRNMQFGFDQIPVYSETNTVIEVI
jgi:hypothetical protein